MNFDIEIDPKDWEKDYLFPRSVGVVYIEGEVNWIIEDHSFSYDYGSISATQEVLNVVPEEIIIEKAVYYDDNDVCVPITIDAQLLKSDWQQYGIEAPTVSELQDNF